MQVATNCKSKLRFELVNDAYQQLVGQRELIGRRLRDVFPEIEGQGYFEILDRVFQTGEPYVGRESRMVLSRREGGPPEECFLNFIYQPFRNSDGSIRGILASGFEVTELVRSRQRTETLAEQARTADRRKDEFLAMLSHELRNPLAPIATALQLMKLRGRGPPGREREVIERQVAHLSRLVDDLLDVSRIASGKVELRRRPLELAEAVDKAVEIVSPLLEGRCHELRVDVPRAGLRVYADPIRLSQVFANLLSNAAKYTPPGGHIVVSARREGEEIVARVRDDGIGIPETLLPRVFDLFVQGSRTADRGEGGLGLGLALVKSLVTLHGGSVEVESFGADQGSEFLVRLPELADGPVETAQASRPVQRPAVRKRVLVVDDNRDAADMLAEALRLAGHEVVVAYDGPEGLSKAQESAFDVGILDLGLPVMDGYEVAQRMRENAGAACLIAITGYGQEEDRRKAIAAGFDDHIVKPADPDKLLTTLAEY